MGNVTLNRELKRYDSFDLYEEDLYYQDAVMDVITNEKFDVLVVSALLQGQLEFADFIQKIRKKDMTLRMIVVTDELNLSMKRKLGECNVTDIFLDDEVEISDIIDAIQREEPIRKRYEMIHQKEGGEHPLENMAMSPKREEAYDASNRYVSVKEPEWSNYDTDVNSKMSAYQTTVTQKQEIIAISGINGSGKSTVAANFARVLAGKTTAKVLLIDLDTLSGNLDEILEINKVPQNVEIVMDETKKSGLNYAAELISKNRFDVNVFDELLINTGNIDVLTGNTSLHYCQNVLSEEHYQKVIECAKERYDFIIIDTSSNIFLDSTKWALQMANRIFFVTENNYISMKKSTQLLEIFSGTWGVWKDKIEVIINKENSNGIESELVRKILKDYELIGRIKQGEEQLEMSYARILESIHYIPKVSFFSKLFAAKPMETIQTNRIPMGKSSNRERMMINAN